MNTDGHGLRRRDRAGVNMGAEDWALSFELRTMGHDQGESEWIKPRRACETGELGENTGWQNEGMRVSGVKPDLRAIRPDQTESNLIKPRRARETGELGENTGWQHEGRRVSGVKPDLRAIRPDQTESNLFGVNQGTGVFHHRWTEIEVGV